MRNFNAIFYMAIVLGMQGATSTVPRFEEFHIDPAFKGKPASPILDSARSREFRTMLRGNADSGPNFADHYTVATWGCGSGCHAIAIIDAISGQVFFEPSILWIGMCRFRGDNPIEFRRDSRLIVFAGARNDEGNGTYYYEWTKDKLVLRHATEIGKPCF